MSAAQLRNPKFLENSLLVAGGLLAHMPLYYQLPRWGYGLDPTFIHPDWVQRFSAPLAVQMISVHPIVWLAAITAILIRIFRNYGWSLPKRCPLNAWSPADGGGRF